VKLSHDPAPPVYRPAEALRHRRPIGSPPGIATLHALDIASHDPRTTERGQPIVHVEAVRSAGIVHLKRRLTLRERDFAYGNPDATAAFEIHLG
jgi:hypothetical protein